MINKKRVWLGLVASLAISPILVATITLPWAVAGEPQQKMLPPRAPDGFWSVAQQGQTEPLNAPPVQPPPDWLPPVLPDRLPSDAQSLPVPPTPLDGGQPGTVEQESPAPPEKFSVSPLKTDPYIFRVQGVKDPAAPLPAAPEVAAVPGIPIYDGLPKLGGGAPAAETARNPVVPSQTPIVQGQTSINTGNVGDLLSKSNSALGVEVQKRSPLVGDPRIEGLHFGQVATYADGAYWFPARVDLDTVVSKINASDIENIRIIRGPFSVRYGPGFSFLDIQSLGTPRYKNGFEAHGSSSINYRTNGQGWQGQQSFWGGSCDWGFRISYDIMSAVDYTTGNGTKMPSGYNNQFVNFAYGFNLDPNSSLELKYLHAQQSNVVFPGLLTDINNMATDAFSARYVATKGSWYDRFTLDTWINGTSFNGDSSNPGTRQQIPQLNNIFGNTGPGAAGGFGGNAVLAANFFPVRLDLTTNGNSLSYGAREITTWGDAKGFNLSLGADVKVFTSNYNEFNAFNFSVAGNTGLPANFGIPYARQIDPGLLLDMSIPLGEQLVIKAGTRVDFVTSQFLAFGPNMNLNNSYINTVGNPFDDRTFALFAGFVTSEYKITDEWNAQAGYGYAERPPTLTELYSGGAFFGLIQNGFNSIYGDPNLRKEAMHQLNLGLNANYEKVRAGVNAFYAFMPNYITYRRLDEPNQNFNVGITLPNGTPVVAATPLQNLRFHNTRLATMYGFDAYTEVDATPWLTPFFTLGFTEGWDQMIAAPLPGIAPLASRVGARFHAEGKNPKWGVEYFARMVSSQNLFANYLGEQYTGGFVTHNLRGFWQPRESIQLTAGVENIGNLQYREHLDLRTGTPLTSGVFQPGINFYAGMRLTY